VAVFFTAILAFGLILLVSFASPDAVRTLGGTTALLLLGVFTVVNLAVLVLRRDRPRHDHFRSPTALPIIGIITCLYLVTPMSGRDADQYVVAGWLLLIGAALFGVTMLINRRLGVTAARNGEPTEPGRVADAVAPVTAFISTPTPRHERQGHQRRHLGRKALPPSRLASGCSPA
jgi:amino acid transporter